MNDYFSVGYVEIRRRLPPPISVPVIAG